MMDWVNYLWYRHTKEYHGSIKHDVSALNLLTWDDVPIDVLNLFDNKY